MSLYPIRVLIVEDSEQDVLLTLRELRKTKYQVYYEQVYHAKAMKAALQKDWDIILADFNMPSFSAYSALAILKESKQDIPCIIVSGAVGEESAVELMRVGASDFVNKNNLTRLVPAIERELREARSRRERRIAEEKLKISNESLEFALDAAQMGVFDWDLQGSHTRWNAHYKRLFGYPQNEEPQVFKTFLRRIHKYDRHLVLQTLSNAFKTQTIQELEFRVIHPDGTCRWLLGKGRAHYDKAGRPLRISGTILDVTPRKEAQERLRLARDEAEAANQAKSNFLANMSHEIRTPLGAILGFSALLNDPHLSEEERSEFQEIIARNGQQLSNLIDDILDLSKIEVGRLEIEYLKVNLFSLVSEVISLFQLKSKEKEISLSYQFDGYIDPEVTTDPTRLRQILVNLVSNAIKFTKSGGRIRLMIKQTVHMDLKREISFFVEDTGIGIGSESQKKLFSPFSQADSSTTREYGGTGLGLSLSKRLAQALGGDVALVKSEIGRGSVFQVNILDQTEQKTRQEKSKIDLSQKSIVKKNRLDNIKILLAEDSKDNQILFNRILSREGAIVEFANNGAEACAKAFAETYDIILMDIQMPCVDGYEAIRRLRLENCAVPIIALTAHAMKEDREKCFAAGCDEHLTKPIEVTRMISTVQRLLEQARV